MLTALKILLLFNMAIGALVIHVIASDLERARRFFAAVRQGGARLKAREP